MRISEKYRNNDNNSDNPLTTRRTDGGKNVKERGREKISSFSCYQNRMNMLSSFAKTICFYLESSSTSYTDARAVNMMEVPNQTSTK